MAASMKNCKRGDIVKKYNKILIITIIMTLLISTFASASSKKMNIEVLFNAINIEINGQKINEDTIVYKGTTYVPLRAVAEMLDKEVGWDQNTNTASINDKQTTSINDKRFEKAIVSNHVDGDTVYVKFVDGKEEKVRFIGVDTPETVHPNKGIEHYGKEASDYTKDKLLGKTIYLEKDVSETDRYGRLLRYVWLDTPKEINEETIKKYMFNAILVIEGYAQVSTFPPDVKYVDYFTQFQKEAVEQNKGLWGSDTSDTNEKANIDQITEGKYVGSAKSDKFHYPNCRWAEKILKENEIWFNTIKEAKKAGYEPCGVCKPK